jgi:tetratricopeptide (TPR) repeat protein
MSRPHLPPHAGPRLTVATIVRNDAAGLTETLSSVADVADEVVVLDAMSHDGTADVARRMGVRVIQRPWDDDFSSARNACSKHAFGDWLLWLDSGERLSAAAGQQIRSLIAKPHVQDRAFRVTVRVPPPSPDAQAEQIAPVRLVPRHPELRFVGRVRETLRESLSAAGIEAAASPLLVERGPREHDPQRKISKARRDLRLAQRDMADRGDCPELLLAKGEALAALGDRAGAIDLLRLAITAAERGSGVQLAAYGSLLATIDGLDTATGDTLGVRVALGLEALDVFPLDAQLLMAMGGYLQAQGQIELAARSFRVAWEHGTVSPDVWHIADARSLAASCLSMMLQMLGRDDEAVDVLESTLVGALDSGRLRRRLLEIHVRNNRRDAALAEAERLAEAADLAGLRAAVRGACFAAAGQWAAAIAQLETAYRQGCRDVLCRRGYANALTATKQPAAALAVVDEWLAAEPHNAEALRLRSLVAGDGCEAAPASAARGDAAHAKAPSKWKNTSHAPRPTLRIDPRVDDAAPSVVPPPRLPTDVPSASASDAAP